MKHIDLPYILEDHRLSVQAELLKFYYQQNDKEKVQKWILGSTNKIPKTLALHSTLCFKSHKSDNADKNYLDSLPKVGPFNADFDNGDFPELAAEDCQKAVSWFINELKLDPNAINPFASGSKGAGFFIDSRALGNLALQGNSKLPLIYKLFAEEHFKEFKTADYSMYCMGRGKLTRRLNYKRSNGNYRTYIPTETFLSLAPAEIIASAYKAGPKLFWKDNIVECPMLVELLTRCYQKLENGTSNFNVRKNNYALVPTEINGHNLSDLPCLNVFNECDPNVIKSEKRFNDLSFLLGLALSRRSEEDAVKEISEFLTKRNSSVYTNYEDRKMHFLKQLACAKNEPPRQKPPCKAIRNSMSVFPCYSCKFLTPPAQVLDQTILVESGDLVVQRLDSKGIQNNLTICNAVPIFKKRRNIYSQDGQIKSSSLVFEFLHEGKVYGVEVASDEIHKRDELQKKLNIASKGKIVVSPKEFHLIFDYARSLEPLEPDENAFENVGFFKNCFVYTNATIMDGQITFSSTRTLVEVPKNSFVKHLLFTDMPIDESALKYEEFLDLHKKIYSPNVLSIAIPYAFVPIISGYAGMSERFFGSFIGPSGSGKTTLAKTVISHYGNYTERGSFISATSTPNRIELEGSRHADIMMLIDDVKDANLSDKKGFQRIFQNNADGTGRQRLTSESKEGESPSTKGNLLTAGEDSFIQGQTSVFARGFELNVKCEKIDTDVVQKITELYPASNSIMPHFIAFLQQSHEPSAIKKRFTLRLRKFWIY